MLRSQDLLNFLRLLQEVYPDSWQNRYSCLSENDRCPKRPDYTCGRCLYNSSCVRIIRINLDFHFYNFRERSLDGTCNNQHHPTMGASFTPYLRTFSSYFADGNQSDKKFYERDAMVALMVWQRNKETFKGKLFY